MFEKVREAYGVTGIAFKADNEFVVAESPITYFKEANKTRDWEYLEGAYRFKGG